MWWLSQSHLGFRRFLIDSFIFKACRALSFTCPLLIRLSFRSWLWRWPLIRSQRLNRRCLVFRSSFSFLPATCLSPGSISKMVSVVCWWCVLPVCWGWMLCNCCGMHKCSHVVHPAPPPPHSEEVWACVCRDLLQTGVQPAHTLAAQSVSFSLSFQMFLLLSFLNPSFSYRRFSDVL